MPLKKDNHREEAKEGTVMSMTIAENTEEAIETFARLLTLGHFAKAADLFEDVLKHYLDELAVFAEYANFLIQQGKYGVLLDRINERASIEGDIKPHEDETVYLELIRVLSMLHFEGHLVKVLDMLEPRNGFYSTLIRPPVECNYIQVSFDHYLYHLCSYLITDPISRNVPSHHQSNHFGYAQGSYHMYTQRRYQIIWEDLCIRNRRCYHFRLSLG